MVVASYGRPLDIIGEVSVNPRDAYWSNLIGTIDSISTIEVVICNFSGVFDISDFAADVHYSIQWPLRQSSSQEPLEVIATKFHRRGYH